MSQIMVMLYPDYKSESHNLAFEISDNDKKNTYRLGGYTDMFVYRFNEKDTIKIVETDMELFQYDIKYDKQDLMSIGVFYYNTNPKYSCGIETYCYSIANKICGIKTWYKYYGLYNKVKKIQSIELTNYGGGQIFVKTLDGKTITLEFNSYDPVIKIMKMIKDKETTLINQQRLIFAGKQLDKEKAIGMYSITKESTIHMVLRLRGGMFHETSGRNGKYKALTTVYFVI
jgi:hypothetical protein